MSAEALFGTGEERAHFEEVAVDRAAVEETTEDQFWPVIASIMFCPAIIAATYGFGC